MTAAEGVVETSTGRQAGWLARGPADGAPVLYLHGSPGCRREQLVWPDDVLDRFGVRLVAVDRPGYGESDPNPGNRISRAADVLAACDALGLSDFAVLAVSSGGTFALTLAAVAADRVTRVVLSSAQMPYDDEAAVAGLQPAQLGLLPALRLGRIPPLVEGFEGFRTGLLRSPAAAMTESLETLTPRERAWYEQPWVQDVFADDITEGVRRSVDGVLDDALAWPVPFEVDVASQVRCPVRAVHGTADDWEPLPNLLRIVGTLADCQVVLLDGLNHLGPMLYPDLVMSLAAGRGA